MEKLILSLIICLFFQIKIEAQIDKPNPHLSGGLNLGYNGGFGVQGNLSISDFALDFPLSIRIGLGYTIVDPGNPVKAREIFINDATNGVPEESGRFWDLRMDFLYPVKIFNLKRAYLYGGPRYSLFSGDFNFVDGNEFFTISSNQWGIGLGSEASFLLSERFDFVVTAGFDYYFLGTIEGHDTAYQPDGEIISGREDFTYKDADNAINQPKFIGKAMMGFNYHF
ncbi:MAG TPA: hypothetical protein VMT35_13360 [Ignavibacteriaceae bacterium]|nr:hypothetical protein [Ignavibacteriaceae bacterium]